MVDCTRVPPRVRENQRVCARLKRLNKHAKNRPEGSRTGIHTRCCRGRRRISDSRNPSPRRIELVLLCSQLHQLLRECPCCALLGEKDKESSRGCQVRSEAGQVTTAAVGNGSFAPRRTNSTVDFSRRFLESLAPATVAMITTPRRCRFHRSDGGCARCLSGRSQNELLKESVPGSHPWQSS